jgi:hypothetical protein
VDDRRKSMQTVKQQLRSIIKKLPDNCTVEDVLYHVYLLQKVRRGVEDIEKGRFHTQEEVEAKVKQWQSEK